EYMSSGRWQVPQLRLPGPESRLSKKSFLPSSTLAGVGGLSGGAGGLPVRMLKGGSAAKRTHPSNHQHTSRIIAASITESPKNAIQLHCPGCEQAAVRRCNRARSGRRNNRARRRRCAARHRGKDLAGGPGSGATKIVRRPSDRSAETMSAQSRYTRRRSPRERQLPPPVFSRFARKALHTPPALRQQPCRG